MIRERRLLVDLEDITHVEVTCPNSECEGTVRCRLQSNQQVPNKCPHCQRVWPEANAIRMLLQQVWSVTDLLTPEHTPTLRLQVPDIAEQNN